MESNANSCPSLYRSPFAGSGAGHAAGTTAQAGEIELVEAFENLKRLVQLAEDDVQKAAGGNKAAGTRARKSMQDIKNAAQEVREEILKARPDKEDSPAGGAAGQS